LDDEVRRVWDGNAQVWARHQAAGYDVTRDLYHNPTFFRFVGDLTGKLVLDAGAGAGTTTREMVRRGMRVVGVDLSPKMIEEARDAEERDPLGIRYEVASIADMPWFADATFDAVLSTMVMMDCADYARAVAEGFRVLKPGGIFAYIVIHPCFAHDIHKWHRDEAGAVTGITVGTYLDQRQILDRWRFAAAPDTVEDEPFQGLYFHRTIATYVNTLTDAGFTQVRMDEPAAPDAAVATEPRMSKFRLFPHALSVKAIKPED